MSPRQDGGSTARSPASSGSTVQPSARRIAALSVCRYIKAAKARRPFGAQYVTAAPVRNRTGGDDLGRLAAAQFEHQPGCDFEPVADKGRVEPALEAVARIA